MSTDDHKPRKNAAGPDGGETVEDLSAKTLDEQEEARVKGGLKDFSFVHKMDKSTPILP